MPLQEERLAPVLLLLHIPAIIWQSIIIHSVNKTRYRATTAAKNCMKNGSDMNVKIGKMIRVISGHDSLSQPAKHARAVTHIQSPTVGPGKDFHRKKGLLRSNDSNSDTKRVFVMGPTGRVTSRMWHQTLH